MAVTVLTAAPSSATAATATVTSQASAKFVQHMLPANHTTSASASAEKYWTQDRMKSAKSLDGSVPVGVKPTAAQRMANATIVQPAAYVPPELPPSKGNAAVGVSSTVGRVFFNDSSGALDACSGSSVTSEAGDMVLTAGHCIYGGANFQNDGKVPRNWYGNWTYVPGYYVDGSGYAHAPYGWWAAWGLVSSGSWYYNADETQDMGIALMAHNGINQPLTTVVGGQGLTIEPPLNQPTVAYGYPVNLANPSAPVNVQTCHSQIGTYYNTLALLICSMGPGSSGGPWLIFQDAWGMGLIAGINTVWEPAFGLMDSPWFSASNILPIYTQFRNT
jgi:hypothetical protein